MVTEQETRRRVRELEGTAVAVAAILAGVELAMSDSQQLSALEAGILTPLVVLSFMAPIFIDELRPGWRRHWIQNDFLKNNLILLGTIITMLGCGLFLFAFDGGLERVVIDTGAGAGMIGSGIYIVRRFSW